MSSPKLIDLQSAKGPEHIGSLERIEYRDVRKKYNLTDIGGAVIFLRCY